jgi:hypothetical protein
VAWQVGLSDLELLEHMVKSPELLQGKPDKDGNQWYPVTVPLALRGKASGTCNHSWLAAPSKMDYQRVDRWETVNAPDRASGFTRLHLQGNQCVMNFMGLGSIDNKWTLDSAIDLNLPEGRVVGECGAIY